MIVSRPSTGPWVGALLRATWKGVRDHIDEAVKEAGYVDLGSSHVSLFRHPTLDGMRPTDLAEEVQISKQTVNDLLGDLERQGYIRRDVDPADRRSRLIRLTAKGMKLEDTVRLAARDAERQIERELGRDQFRSFREALVEAARMLNDRA
ncbi:MAG: MarR family winged helix-turn-helix transcriptional regulator [Rubrobacteraceae bacterium]